MQATYHQFCLSLAALDEVCEMLRRATVGSKRRNQKARIRVLNLRRRAQMIENDALLCLPCDDVPGLSRNATVRTHPPHQMRREN